MTLYSRRLLAFVAVAEELHFGRAADRLRMSQPPLSQQIRQLEASVGVALFERTTRSVELTPAGQVLLDRARRLIHDAHGAVDATHRAARGELGSLSLGFTATAAFQVLPRAISAYRGRYPEVALMLHEYNSAEQVEALRRGRIDVGLLRHHGALDDPALRFERIASEPMQLAMPKGHALARFQRVPLRALDGQDFIGFDARASRYFDGLLRRLFERAGCQPRVVHLSVLPTILALVEAGVGVALVPASAADLRPGRVEHRPLSGAGVAGTALLHCAVREGDARPPVRALTAVLRGL